MMGNKCGFEWWAPYIGPSGAVIRQERQVCVKAKDHKDDHQSNFKVICPNEQGQTNGC